MRVELELNPELLPLLPVLQTVVADVLLYPLVLLQQSLQLHPDHLRLGLNHLHSRLYWPVQAVEHL